MLKILLTLLVFSGYAHACTAFQLKSDDGAVVYCRSLEFGMPLDSNLLIVPRGVSFKGTTPDGKGGLQWKSKYGYVGMNQSFSPTNISDGMNEKGLVIGMLYLPGFAKYETPDLSKSNRMLGYWEVGSFLLATCTTVEEIKNVLPTILAAQEEMPGMGDSILPLHFYIGDSTGATIVVEYVDGERYVYDNPLNVLTNSPPFPWHLLNLTNFIKMSPENAPDLAINTYKVQFFGQGSGLLGLPGDYTPASRFVRAALFSQFAAKQKTAVDAVRTGFHVLNTFDIFDGAVRSGKEQENTEWVVVHDQTNLKTYFRTYNGLRIQMVDLKKLDFGKEGFQQVQLGNTFVVDDLTKDAKPLK